ncbi:MAG: hypothetical protein KF764_27340 [Labilithrix sp.]|nr:hypothetical protein [Labilithrix sp.]
MRTIRCALAVLATAVVVSGARFAAAQEEGPAAAPAEATAAAPAISEQAKRHFNAGVALLQDPEGEKVEEAYRQFRTAYDISGSPKILGNMGFCAMRLERDGEAIDAYSRYLREVPDIDADERAQIVRDLQTLTVGVARISLEVNVPGATILDERVPVRGARVTNAYGPVNGKIELGVRPGHHVFTAKIAGREDAPWEIEAYAGAKEQHSFVLKAPPEAPPPRAITTTDDRPSSTGPIVVTAAGGAMLVAAGITGIVALNKTSDIAERCKNDVCPRSFDLEGERSSARTFVGVTDLLLVLGTVTVLGGLYWGYRVSKASSEPKAAPAPAKASFLGDWRLAL